MAKITFMGAGSTVFLKNILGDALLTPSLQDAHFALYDIDAKRLTESNSVLTALNSNINHGRATISTWLGVENRKKALSKADYVINSIQVGGYKPSTVIDFEIPRKFGIRQTIGDTIGIGGIFRALRTIPVVLDFVRDMEQVCPNAWFLNYVNPMAMLTGALQRSSSIKTVGLCHSVQYCLPYLLNNIDMGDKLDSAIYKIAGINHQAWLLEVSSKGVDLYPEIKRRAFKKNRIARAKGATKHYDMVRFEIMRQFGYYVTESSEHAAEYVPYFIKQNYPNLIEEFGIPLDEYPRRCIEGVKGWKEMARDIVHNARLDHTRSIEFGASIMEAMETNVPCRIHGNVLNTGLITNLPPNSCVEVPCLVDKNGIQPCFVGDLPEQCAALNRTNVNVHLLGIEAALTHKKEKICQAALLDPHTSSELSIDDTVALCDELIKAHGKMLPKFS